MYGSDTQIQSKLTAATAAAAVSFDWIWASDASPSSFASFNTDEAEVTILMALICSETPVDITGER